MKILFTTPILEHPAVGGPQLRIENSIKALNKISQLHIISRVSQNILGGSEAEIFYKSYCYKFQYTPRVQYFFSKRLLRKVEARFNKFYLQSDADYIIQYAEKNAIDIIWFGFGNISYNLMREIKNKRPKFKLVCDTDSVWSRFILRELPLEKDEKRRKEIKLAGSKKEKEEKEWVDFCDITTAVSEVDAKYYRSLLVNKEKIKVFSNGELSSQVRHFV